jgi:sugar O-acyltransferase (sialic acid O-acetyltransferase NeuD family)
MHKIALVGFGELGNQVLSLISPTFEKEMPVVCFDDYVAPGRYKILPFQDYQNDQYNKHHFFVALGYKHLGLKNKILNELIALQRKLLTFVHPSCYVSNEATIADGCILYPMCNIDRQVVIKRGALLNNSVTVSHDCVIGECCFVSPGVVMAGNVKVGDSTFIGAGSVISSGVNIGNNVIIGVGSVITSDIADGSSVIGNPARLLSHPIKLK